MSLEAAPQKRGMKFGKNRSGNPMAKYIRSKGYYFRTLIKSLN